MNSLFFFGLLALFRVGFFTGPMYQIISSSNSDLVNQPEEKKEFAKGKPLGLVLENIFKSCPCLLFFFFFLDCLQLGSILDSDFGSLILKFHS